MYPYARNNGNWERRGQKVQSYWREINFVYLHYRDAARDLRGYSGTLFVMLIFVPSRLGEGFWMEQEETQALTTMFIRIVTRAHSHHQVHLSVARCDM